MIWKRLKGQQIRLKLKCVSFCLVRCRKVGHIIERIAVQDRSSDVVLFGQCHFGTSKINAISNQRDLPPQIDVGLQIINNIIHSNICILNAYELRINGVLNCDTLQLCLQQFLSF